MERPEFVEALTPLVLAMRAEFDMPTWTAYYLALRDIPLPLLYATVDALLHEPLEFFPKAGEIRAKAERQRRVLLVAHPYDGCCECEDSKGWRAVLVDSMPKVERCPCSQRHKAKLAGMGLAEPVARLLSESEPSTDTPHPTFEQLPEGIRTQMQDIANRKLLR